jgi:hypothetical protein
MRRGVYNLEFPAWRRKLEILGYEFFRADDYRDRLLGLSHLTNFQHEFPVVQNAGSNLITSHVEIPKKEEQSALAWSGKVTALSDILLLLSIFTGREVFLAPKQGNGIVFADPRQYHRGGIIRSSIPYTEKLAEGGETYDAGLELTINGVCNLVRSPDWNTKYGQGRFLFLVRSMLRPQTIESAFIGGWIIWEHLFTILNQSWLSQNQNRRITAIEKLSFILVRYRLLEKVEDYKKGRLRVFSRIRNNLVHQGAFIDEDTIDNARLFIEVTENVIARILGLEPSNVFNTQEHFQGFLE